MNSLEQQTKESAEEALIESLNLLMRASNKSTNRAEIDKLAKQRRKVIKELDRVDLAQLNDMLLPDQVKNAVKELDGFTKELQTEKARIKKATERLKKIDEYIGYATKAITFATKLFV